MTCAPLLLHLRDGIQQLTNQMEEESHRRKLEEFFRKGFVEHSGGDASQSLPADEPSRKRVSSNVTHLYLIPQAFLFPLLCFLFRHGVRSHDKITYVYISQSKMIYTQ